MIGEHSTTKLAPFRVMMNIENKDLIHKISLILLDSSTQNISDSTLQ